MPALWSKAHRQTKQNIKLALNIAPVQCDLGTFDYTLETPVTAHATSGMAGPQRNASENRNANENENIVSSV